VTEYCCASAVASGDTERELRVKAIKTKWILRCQYCRFLTLYTARSLPHGHK